MKGIVPLWILVLILLEAVLSTTARAGQVPSPWAEYFARETARLEEKSPVPVASEADWRQLAPELRRQLREMLGLEPLPARTPLNPVVSSIREHGDFVVEQVQFQSSPGLYVTGNLYRPRETPGPLPAILYVCGHGPSRENGISYGNKVTYQHHGAWFARHGYVCLTIDTIQLGELEGLHHGTYREGMWWWNSLGYTPAGVEAWNSMRAIDYLQSRKEVDPERIGMTGRSGGGAYTWWTAALDERVRVAVPVAGITDLHNHVIDGVVEGHCDCMFMVNTHRWDYGQVAALVAPRPLLIANTDRDSIFPLDGVLRVHSQVAALYRTLHAEDQLGLLITDGPHKDTQDLQVPAFRWFNRFLKGDDPLIQAAAEKYFDAEQLKVFEKLPEDQITTRIHQYFVAPAPQPPIPRDRHEWETMKDQWRGALLEQSFAAWPGSDEDVSITRSEEQVVGHRRIQVLKIETQPGLALPLVVVVPEGSSSKTPLLVLLDNAGWRQLGNQLPWDWLRQPEVSWEEPVMPDGPAVELGRIDRPTAYFSPRGMGITAPNLDERGFVHFRRRFMMLGQTLDGMRVWDIRQAIRATAGELNTRHRGLEVSAVGTMAVNGLYAGLYEPAVTQWSLAQLPSSHRDGPDYLNVLKIMDIPIALAMATDGREMKLTHSRPGILDYSRSVQRRTSDRASGVEN